MINAAAGAAQWFQGLVALRVRLQARLPARFHIRKNHCGPAYLPRSARLHASFYRQRRKGGRCHLPKPSDDMTLADVWMFGWTAVNVQELTGSALCQHLKPQNHPVNTALSTCQPFK